MCKLMSPVIVSICELVVITSQCGEFSSSVLVVSCLRFKSGRRNQKYFATYERFFVIMKGVIWRIIIEFGEE